MPLNLKKVHVYDQKSAASWLAKRNNYDLEGAIKADFSYKEVIDHLNKKEADQNKLIELSLCPPIVYTSKDKDIGKDRDHEGLEKLFQDYGLGSVYMDMSEFTNTFPYFVLNLTYVAYPKEEEKEPEKKKATSSPEKKLNKFLDKQWKEGPEDDETSFYFEEAGDKEIKDTKGRPVMDEDGRKIYED
jgi:hypothetical protein